MKKLTFIAAFAMSLFCVLGSPSVYAQEQQGRKPAMRKIVDPETSARELTDRMKEELKLTEKQYKKVYKLNLKEAEAMADENKPEMPDGMVGPEEGRGGMRPGMRPDGMRMEPGRGMRPRPGDGTDNADFSEKAEQMKKREEKMDKKMKKILDDGQYAKWQDMMKERRERQKRELDLQRQRRELGLPEKA